MRRSLQYGVSVAAVLLLPLIAASCRTGKLAPGSTLERDILGFMLDLPVSECDTVYVHPLIGNEYLGQAWSQQREWHAVSRMPVRSEERRARNGRTYVFEPFSPTLPAPGCLAFAASIQGSMAGEVYFDVEVYYAREGEWAYSTLEKVKGRQANGAWQFEIIG